MSTTKLCEICDVHPASWVADLTDDYDGPPPEWFVCIQCASSLDDERLICQMDISDDM